MFEAVVGTAIVVSVPAYVLATEYLAFLHLWIDDVWLVPLLMVMACDVTGGFLLAVKTHRFSWSVLAWGHARKLLVLMAVAVPFTLQAINPAGFSWGTYALMGAFAYEGNSFRRILAKFDICLPVLDAVIAFVSSRTEPITKQLHHEEIANRAKVRVVETLTESGIIRRDAVERIKATLRPDDLPRPGDGSAMFDSYE